MTDDHRSAYDTFLNVTGHYSGTGYYDREDALAARVTDTLQGGRFAEAQVYALLMIGDAIPREPIKIMWDSWEDFATALSAPLDQITRTLDRVENALMRLEP